MSSRNLNQEASYKENILNTIFDIVCPKCSSHVDNSTTPNWNRKWCRIRIEYGNKCTTKCPIAENIRQTEGIREWKEW